jgi:hypothetical protein
MLSSGMITPPFFIFPGNFTHSLKINMACSDSVICVYCTVGYSSRKEGPAGPWVNATGKEKIYNKKGTVS